MANIVSVYIVDTDSGELMFHIVRDIHLDIEKERLQLHHYLDNFLNSLRDNSMLSFEIVGYKSHEQLKLPF